MFLKRKKNVYQISNYSWISEPGLWTRQNMFQPQMGKNPYLAGLEVSFHHPLQTTYSINRGDKQKLQYDFFQLIQKKISLLLHKISLICSKYFGVHIVLKMACILLYSLDLHKEFIDNTASSPCHFLTNWAKKLGLVWNDRYFLENYESFYELESKPCMKPFYTIIYTFLFD